MQLDPIALEAGMRLLALASVGSTNQEARQEARSGARGPLWITAQTQTAGRGRLGRKWVSPPGNLYASLLLAEPSAVENAPELAFVTALAVRDAVAAEAPALSAQLSFKWPNDLLLAGEKCAGILIEGEVSTDGALGPGKRFVVVVGVGVNCAHHPPTAPPAGSEPSAIRRPVLTEETASYPATDLAAHGAAVTPQRLFRRLSATMCRRLAAWDRGRGFSAILGDWLNAAHGLGGDITVRTAGAGGVEKRGRFFGLDQSGRLLLQQTGGSIEKISAGDVFPFELSDYRRLPRRSG